MMKLEMVKLGILVSGSCCDEAADGDGKASREAGDEAGDDEAAEGV